MIHTPCAWRSPAIEGRMAVRAVGDKPASARSVGHGVMAGDVPEGEIVPVTSSIRNRPAGSKAGAASGEPPATCWVGGAVGAVGGDIVAALRGVNGAGADAQPAASTRNATADTANHGLRLRCGRDGDILFTWAGSAWG